jgi:hypothetical protein
MHENNRSIPVHKVHLVHIVHIVHTTRNFFIVTYITEFVIIR